MRAPLIVAALAAASFLAGCFSYYGNTPVYGAYRAVSPIEFRAVIAAAYKGKPQPHKVYKFHVASKDEVWVYHSPPESMTAGSYYIVKRIDGRWRCDEQFNHWTIRYDQ